MLKASQLALSCLGVALCVASHSAQATSTAGWSEADRSAATIREFQTRLMVAALRCRAAGINVLASYNQFIAADRAEIAAANDRLKTHFASINSVTGDRDYDRYTTSLANNYAGEQWSPQSCDAAERLARRAAQSQGNLLAVAASDSTEEVASASPSPWAAYDRAGPQSFGDAGPTAGHDGGPSSARAGERWQGPQAYEDDGPPPGYRDDWRSDQSYDRGPPPGYYDQAPSWRERDDWQAPQAYNDHSPPPGYYDQAPPSGYDDRGPPPGYDDRSEPRGYGGY
jgi:hypothetical protein